MVNNINAAGNNPLANVLAQNLGKTEATDNVLLDTLPANVNKYAGQNNDGSTRTEISPQARLLAQAINFGRQVPSDASLLTEEDKVADLKALYQTGGVDALLARYNNDDLADSMMKSPIKAFLR